ncbi:MAG TPA: RNA polymerase factor sigma-54 [Gammaproteobacteria bacterium]|nr:RNA polymerase factor sigma-54 [Gammaproteobacteria bacterium]
MKASLGLRQIHRLAMTPELRQALGLLQMSALELRDLVQQALENNLLLERIDDGDEAPLGEITKSPPEDSQAPEESISETTEELPEVEWDSADVDVTWGGGAGEEFAEPTASVDISLQDYLHQQLELTRLSARDAAIGALIIDSLNEDGYLTASLDELRQAFDDQGNSPELEEMEAVLHQIQTLDPPGVAARDLSECLSLQLRQLEPSAIQELALQVASGHLQELAEHSHAQLCRQLDAGDDELAAAITLIQSLNPRPGTGLASSAVDFIIPDVVLSRRDERWVVELNPAIAPRLRVNSMYAAAIGRRRNGENADLGRQLQEARWLIRSLKMRNHTLLRVAECIVRHQADFLDAGEESMHPLMLKDVAAELELHESTISRVVANKYLATPRGTLAFRHFFSNELSTDDGGALSSVAIRALIRKLLVQEDPNDPLSDDRITKELVSRGIQVARRTVAKYRESMTIPPAHKRKRLAMR